MRTSILQMGVNNVEESLIALEMVLANTTDPADISNTNLETIKITFEIIADNDSIAMDRDILESATHIISEIQSWGMNNATNLTVLQESSAE